MDTVILGRIDVQSCVEGKSLKLICNHLFIMI